MFEKAKDETTLRMMYESAVKQANSMLEIKVLEAACKKKLTELRGAKQ